MKLKVSHLFGAISTAILLAGCNIGNAPAGASVDQVKAQVAKQDPLQQIRDIMYEPQMPSQKEARIKEIEKKYGVKREDAMKNLPPVKFSMAPPTQFPTKS